MAKEAVKEPRRSYRIGEVANRAGISVEALRYYEKRGLLPSPQRTRGGFRLYPETALQQVRFIRQAQALGLTLEDIQQLVAGHERLTDRPSCRSVRDLLTRRIEDIDARIEGLRSFRRTLRGHLIACEAALADEAEPPCPTVAALAERRTR